VKTYNQLLKFHLPMKYAELSIEREIDFMIKYQLTADELFVLKLIFYAQDEHPEYLINFFSQNNLTKSLRDNLLALQEKGIINKSYKVPPEGTKFNAKDVELNKLIIKSFLQHSSELGMELFMNYPTATIIDGRTFSLRNITKLYKSIDDLSFNYGKMINFSPEKHQEVMELLSFGKENNLIHSGICDFIASMKWLDLKELRDNDMGTFNTTILI